MHKKFGWFLLLIMLIQLLPATLLAAAKIEVDKADADAGTVMKGEKQSIKHTFIIKNTGTDTLVIEKVKPG